MAEYKAIANVADEIIWIQSLLKELNIFLTTSPILWCDNLRATYLSINPVMHARTTHIEMDYHFVWERVAAKTLQVSFILTKNHIADIFTKSLFISRFSQFRSWLTFFHVSIGSMGNVKDQIIHQMNNSQQDTPWIQLKGQYSRLLVNNRFVLKDMRIFICTDVNLWIEKIVRILLYIFYNEIHTEYMKKYKKLKSIFSQKPFYKHLVCVCLFWALLIINNNDNIK